MVKFPHYNTSIDQSHYMYVFAKSQNDKAEKDETKDFRLIAFLKYESKTEIHNK